MNPIEKIDIKAESKEFCHMNYKEIVNEMNPIQKTDIKVESEEFFHMNDEEIVNEINPIQKTDNKAESEEFCRMNDVQGNYDGMTWMIIFVNILLLILRVISVLICFHVLSNINQFIRL